MPILFQSNGTFTTSEKISFAQSQKQIAATVAKEAAVMRQAGRSDAEINAFLYSQQERAITATANNMKQSGASDATILAYTGKAMKAAGLQYLTGRPPNLAGRSPNLPTADPKARQGAADLKTYARQRSVSGLEGDIRLVKKWLEMNADLIKKIEDHVKEVKDTYQKAGDSPHNRSVFNYYMNLYKKQWDSAVGVRVPALKNLAFLEECLAIAKKLRSLPHIVRGVKGSGWVGVGRV